MSEKNKNKKSLLTDFNRYRRNEMTGIERNSFERELQRDPFAEEAEEGLSSISPEEVNKDINHLQKRLKSRIVRRQKYIFYRIAASVAVLMVISSIFIIVERNKSSRLSDEKVSRSEALEITVNKPISKPDVKEKVSEDLALLSEEKADKVTGRQIKAETVKGAIPSENIKIAKSQIPDSIPEIKVRPVEDFAREDNISSPLNVLAKAKTSSAFRTKGRVLSSEDNMPVPGASISVKGTNTGVMTDAGGNFSINLPDTEKRTLVANFIGMKSKEFEAKADSQIQVRLDPSITSLDEVVVVGYGVRRAESENDVLTSGYIAPHPVSGKPQFDKYIEENQKRPDTTTAGQRVVVVISFIVQTDGSIDSIKVVRSPGKQFSDEAIRLIKSGPSWKPAEQNGKLIEDDVRVRIVFR